MTKLNVAYIVADDTDEWFKMSVQQASKVANQFVFVIDKPSSYTWSVIELAQELKPTRIIHKRYEHESKKADGTQRNVYLDYLKNNNEGEWCLVLDTDEILQDNPHTLLNYVNQDETDCFNIRMRHVWFALGIEDSTFDKHYVPTRLFKIRKGMTYPAVEHPTLQGYAQLGIIDDCQIWHMNVVKSLLSEISKYKKQCEKSNIHTQQELLLWHAWHVLGTNLLKRFDMKELPQVVKDFACINDLGEPKLYEVK